MAHDPVEHWTDQEVKLHVDYRLDPGKICFEEHGVQKGTQRFNPRADEHPPAIAWWRNNLTALSQRRNLYFVACKENIHVYEPKGGSWNQVSSEPSLVITPALKNPSAGGYIDIYSPHTINSILLDDLGHEEVLVLATDSGNVTAFWVEQIFRVIERAKEVDVAADGSLIEPFFAEWVELSAWGLAIHKYARLIAVSSNTCLVTVFAFALAEPSNDSILTDSELEVSQDDWLVIEHEDQFAKYQESMPKDHRRRNVRLTYHGHDDNVPNISFLNSDLDRDGCWMVTTDINNQLLVYKIWEKLGPIKCHDFYSHLTPYHSMSDMLGQEQRGWGVLAVDPRDFRVKRTVAQAFGGLPSLKGTGNLRSLELAHVMWGIPARSVTFGRVRAQSPISEPTELVHVGHDPGTPINEARRSHDSTDYISDRDVEDESVSEDGSSLEDGEEPDTTEQECPESHISQEDEHGHGSHESAMAELSVDRGVSIEDILMDGLDGAYEFDEEGEDDLEEYNEPHHEPIRRGSLIRDPRTQTKEEDVYRFMNQGKNRRREGFSIMHFSETDVRLLDDPFGDGPSVTCGNLLAQVLDTSISSLSRWDRFNMYHLIPELGVVIAASQVGRMAVLALTELEDQDRVAFRVDWTAPTSRQEADGHRPLCPLLGMAVGPLPSHLIPQESPPTSPDARTAPADGDGDTPSQRDQRSDPEGSKGHHPYFLDRDGKPPFRMRGYTREEFGRLMAENPQSPVEPWHGRDYSRWYRVMLYYYDHTVLTYYLYYDWPKELRSNDPFMP